VYSFPVLMAARARNGVIARESGADRVMYRLPLPHSVVIERQTLPSVNPAPIAAEIGLFARIAYCGREKARNSHG
jgi:hypothetical protein